jgi:hypothetical protein
MVDRSRLCHDRASDKYGPIFFHHVASLFTGISCKCNQNQSGFRYDIVVLDSLDHLRDIFGPVVFYQSKTVAKAFFANRRSDRFFKFSWVFS